MRRLINLLGMGLLLSAGRPAAPPAPLLVQVQQGGKMLTPGPDLTPLTLQRDTFALVFDCRPYSDAQRHAADVVIATSPKALAGIKVGLRAAKSLYLEDGACMAGTNQGYTSILPDTEAKHCLYYETEADRRLTLLHPNPDGSLHLAWPITHVLQGKRDVPLRATALQTLYFAVFIDHNLNDRIDAGELARLAVQFK